MNMDHGSHMGSEGGQLHHHSDEAIKSHPQILGSVNSGHILGHLVPGLALFVGGAFMVHIICLDLFGNKSDPTYEKVDEGKKHKSQSAQEDDEYFFRLYMNPTSRRERKGDRFRFMLGLYGIIFVSTGIVLEGFGAAYAGLGFFFQYEHMILYSSYLPFLISLLYESGRIKNGGDFVELSPVPSQIFLGLAFYANNLLWNAHLKSKAHGWDYDGHLIFVIITKLAYITIILFLLAALGDFRKFATSVYVILPLGAIMNGLWLLTHVVILIVFDVQDQQSPVQEIAYPLFIVETFISVATYFSYLRRRSQ